MPRQTRIPSLTLVLGLLSFAGNALAEDARATTVDPTSPSPEAPSAAPTGPFWTGPRVAAAMWIASGVPAIVIGSIYAAKADESTSQLKWHCWSIDQDRCDAEGFRLRAQATDDARVSSISLGIGASALVLGFALGFWNPEAHPAKAPATLTPRVAIAPFFGPAQSGGAQGILLLGSF